MFQRFVFVSCLVIAMVLCSTAAFAGKMELTTYYPAPYGEYKNLNSTEGSNFATSSGNVGIGTTTPTGTLDVQGGVAAVNTKGSNISFYAQDGGPGVANGGNILLMPGTGQGIGTPGLVGVGTLDPQAKLDVSGPYGQANTIRVGSLNFSAEGASKYAPTLDGEVAASVVHLERTCGSTPGEHCPEINFRDITSMSSPDYSFVIKASGDNLGFFTRYPLSNGPFLDLDNSTAITTVDVGAEEFSFRGACIHSTTACASDIRLKKNVHPLSGSLEKIIQLKPSSFEFIDTARGEGIQYGLIAQDVEKVMPDWVMTREDGYKGVKYEQQIPMHLIEAVKELNAKVDAMQETIEKQREEIDLLKKR